MTNAAQHQSPPAEYLSLSILKPPSQKRNQILQLQALPACDDLLAPPQDIAKPNALQIPSLLSRSLFAITRDTPHAYQAELHTDTNSGDVDIQDPRVYSAKKKSDPDMPSLYKALHGEHADQYMEAMKQEIQSLFQQSTWTTVRRSESQKSHQVHLVFHVELTSRWSSIQDQGEILRPRRLARRRGGLL
jgi:hypothetical protein